MLLAIDPLLQLAFVAGFIIALILFARYLNRKPSRRSKRRR